MTTTILARGVPISDARGANDETGSPAGEQATKETHAIAATLSGGMVYLTIDSLQIGSWVIRRAISDTTIGEMKHSLSVHGMHQPILARPFLKEMVPSTGAPTHEVVAGHVRFLAAKQLGLVEVPCIVRDMTDEQAMEAAIIENIVRSDLAILDEAHAVAQFKEACNLSVRGTAARLGKGRGWVQERLDIVSLPQDLQDLLSRRPDTASHAREIEKVTDSAKRRQLIRQVSDAAMSLIELRRHVKAIAEGVEVNEPEAASADGGAGKDAVASIVRFESGGEDQGRKTEVPAPLSQVTDSTTRRTHRPLEPRTSPPFNDIGDVFAEIQSTMRFMLGVRPPAERDARKRLRQDLDELLNIVLQLMSNIEEYADEG